MFGQNGPHIREASVAQFECTPVENWVQGAAFGKTTIYQTQEFLGYICLDILGEGRVEPSN